MSSAQPRVASRRRIPKWLWWFAAVLLAIIAAGAILFAVHWPFTRKAVTEALAEASGRPVRYESCQTLHRSTAGLSGDAILLACSGRGTPTGILRGDFHDPVDFLLGIR